MVETDAEFLARVKGLAEKATPGEWNQHGNGTCPCGYIFGKNGEIYIAKALSLSDDVDPVAVDHLANAAFIAASRTATLRLIGMVEERERERDEARKKYDEHFINRIMEIPDADLLALIPKDERDAAVVQGKQALKIAILTVEREAVAEAAALATNALAALASKDHPHD